MGETENNARILLFDDVMENIKVAGSVLKENGYQLNIAKNGKIALKV
jgi:CheY-like chemotaxis protein